MPGHRTEIHHADIMNTRMSVHLMYSDDDDAAANIIRHCGLDPQSLPQENVSTFFNELRAYEAILSPFRADSAISRLREGLALPEAVQTVPLPAGTELGPAAVVVEIEHLCQSVRELTRGRFDAWWRGWFDPTGLTKGWAVERAFNQHLTPMLGAEPALAAAGVYAGGDIRVATCAGADWQWGIGVEDPFDRQALLATFNLADGAVATSGPAARGAHIIDPATARPVATTGSNATVSATVVAASLDQADLWATTAVVAGFDHLDWLEQARTLAGVLVAGDGRVKSWQGTTVTQPKSPTPASLPTLAM